MKKIFTAVLAVAAAGVLSSVTAAADDTVYVYVDNARVTFSDQEPVIVDSRTLVPLRAVFEKAGASVNWNDDTKTATITAGDEVVSVTIDSDVMKRGDSEITLDVPAQIIGDRTMIPVRAISEALDYGVTWNQYQRSVLVSTKGYEYRTAASKRTGFLTLEDACEFIYEDPFYDVTMDVNNDGTADKVTFIPSDSELDVALRINDVAYTDMLPQNSGKIKKIALVNTDMGTTQAQIVIIGGYDMNCAWFYSYSPENGLQHVSVSGDSGGGIRYMDNLFFNNRGIVLSDTDGLSFTDSMLICKSYEMDSTDMNLDIYRLEQASGVTGATFTAAYADNVALWIKNNENTFRSGTYYGTEGTMTISPSDLGTFKLLDYYCDPYDPSKAEFHVELSSGRRAVIWMYQP